jgi:hypothetical protein
MAKKKVKASEVLLDLPVKFGNVSLGVRTGKISFSIDRSQITLAKADEYFVDRRLTGKLVLGRNGDSSKQTQLVEDLNIEIPGAFDVKGFRVGAEKLSSLGATFYLKEVELHDAARFSGGSGRLVVNNVDFIPEDAEDEFEETERPMLAEGPWSDVSLDELFDPKAALRANLKKASINTVGELANLTAAKGETWSKGIPGIGPSARQKIEDRLEKFWAENPQYSKESV